MPCSRDRLTVESGPTLNLARLIPPGAGRPRHHYCLGRVVSRGKVALGTPKRLPTPILAGLAGEIS